MSLMYSDVTPNKGESSFPQCNHHNKANLAAAERPSNLEKGHRYGRKAGPLLTQVAGH